MTTDPDPFEEGQHAARKNIPAEGNPYRDGSDEHSLWAAALAELAQGPGLIEFGARHLQCSIDDRARRRILSASQRPRPIVVERQPTFFRPFLNRGPLVA